jgi:hypothetical protein
VAFLFVMRCMDDWPTTSHFGLNHVDPAQRMKTFNCVRQALQKTLSPPLFRASV